MKRIALVAVTVTVTVTVAAVAGTAAYIEVCIWTVQRRRRTEVFF